MEDLQAVAEAVPGGRAKRGGAGDGARAGRLLTSYRLALPFVVALGGCAATLWLWGRLVQERRAGAVARAATLADSLADLLQDGVSGRLRGFQSLLELYAVDGVDPERLSLMGRRDLGFSSLEASRAAPGEALPDAALQIALRPPFLVIAGTSRGARLEARTPIEAVLDAQLRERATDYALQVRDGGALLYARGDPAPDRDWWVQTRAVELPEPMQGDWTLTVAPSTALARLPVANLPAYFRTAGVAISLLIAALLYQASVGYGRHLALERSHAALRSEVEVRERAEEDLRRLNVSLERRVADHTAELDAAVADLEAFTYSVSHDLRSPLGAVVNFAGILREDYGETLDEEGRDHLERITASALSALAMMDGLAALSRLGRARPRIDTVDMAALADEVFDEAVVSSPTREARLELGSLPPARGDAAMLRTVFTNLFTNALKFADPERPLVVEVGARREEAENVYWVQDNGVGFESRFAERVFRLFERLHGSGGYSGTGIGLAIVARVIRFHGGRVWAQAEPDAGARFSFTLPRGD